MKMPWQVRFVLSVRPSIHRAVRLSIMCTLIIISIMYLVCLSVRPSVIKSIRISMKIPWQVGFVPSVRQFVYLPGCLSFHPSVRNNNLKYLCEYCIQSIPIWHENTLACRFVPRCRRSHLINYLHLE